MIDVAFLQKIHEFMMRSDDSIFGQFGVKFLSEHPITAFDLAVVRWGSRR